MKIGNFIPRGRFAPSPTGRMHLGNVLCALLSYLSIKSKGGEWVLRIEDLDRSRSRKEYARQLEEDLHRLGLDWDYGGVDAEDGKYCQSNRNALYEEEFKKISGFCYPCYCSRADLLAAGAPHESDGRVVYSGKCRPVRLGGSFNGSSEGRASTRLWVPDRQISFDDIHYGHYSENLARDCGDFIIRRADGGWAYQLAVVADDAAMGITEVVRGRDLLSSTPQQLYLYELLGYKAPSFAHIPLLCNASGQRLCKRDICCDLGKQFKHHNPQEIIGHLAYLAGIIPNKEKASPGELASIFDWSKVVKQDILVSSSN